MSTIKEFPTAMDKEIDTRQRMGQQLYFKRMPDGNTNWYAGYPSSPEKLDFLFTSTPAEMIQWS